MSSTHVTVARARHGASVARGARALEGARGKIARGRAARGILVVRAAGDKEDTEVEAKARVGYSAARKRSPKPLPSTFGDAGKGKVKGFEDPFERAKSSAGSKPPAASPFDMPASALDAATSAEKPAAASAAATPASPFGAAAPASAPAAKPASPFGAAAPSKPAGGSPFADAGAASTASKGASPFAQSASANPFGEASATRSKPKAAAEEDTRNAWEKLPKPAMAQVVIVLSFTTIISLMLATFWVVVQVRSIPFSFDPVYSRPGHFFLFVFVHNSTLTYLSLNLASQLGGVSFNDQ
jgi:nucleoporin NUP42